LSTNKAAIIPITSVVTYRIGLFTTIPMYDASDERRRMRPDRIEFRESVRESFSTGPRLARRNYDYFHLSFHLGDYVRREDSYTGYTGEGTKSIR